MEMLNNRQGNTKSKFFILVLMGCLGITSYAYSFEFDTRIFNDIGFTNVDLSAFSGENDQFSGEYLAKVSINDQVVLKSQSVHFYTLESGSYVCFTPELIQKLPLKKSVISSVYSDIIHTTDAGNCLGLESLDNAIGVEFNSRDQVLSLQIPHVFLDEIDTEWIAPADRDSGISGAFIDYNLLGTYNKQKQQSSENSFRSYGVIGANIGKIRIRGNYQYDSDNKNSKSFEWTQRYGFMDVGSLNAKIFAGELYTRSNVFQSVRFKGISFYTDENMMPAYLQGYAPEITGTANSNAIVTLRQYGNVLKSVQVPPGPFAIADLPSYISGTIDVEIEESSGEIRRYQVDVAQVPFLTRKGTMRYSANIGRLNPMRMIGQQKVDDNFVSADASYGLTNDISIYGGTQFTTNNDYKAVNAGLGFNLGILGAFSLDITKSANKANAEKEMKGHSYRFNYAKRLGATTSLNLVGYRFSSRNFTSIHNYIDMKEGSSRRVALEKNRITLSVSQSIPSIQGSVSASITKGTYWNQQSISNYNVAFSKVIDRGIFESTSVQLSLMHNTNQDGVKDKQIGIYVTIPLDSNYQKRVQYNARYSHEDKGVSQQATYYDQAFGGDISFGASANHQRDFSGSVEYSLNATYNRDLAFGKIQTTADYSSNNKRATASLDGSITATQHGIATHKRVYENGSRLIVDIGAPGVAIGEAYNTSNIFGIAGISNIPNYYRMTYKVDNDLLPDDVEVQNSVVEVAVTDGAIAYRSLGAVSGEKSISTIELADGTYPPFGAVVYRENGQDREIGIVSEKGLTYLTGLNKHAAYTVKWGKDQSCLLKIESLDPSSLEKITCYME